MTDNQLKFENKIGGIFLLIFIASVLMLITFLIGMTIGVGRGEEIGLIEGYSSAKLTPIPGGTTFSYIKINTGEMKSFFLTQQEEEYIAKVKKEK